MVAFIERFYCSNSLTEDDDDFGYLSAIIATARLISNREVTVASSVFTNNYSSLLSCCFIQDIGMLPLVAYMTLHLHTLGIACSADYRQGLVCL